MQKYYKFLEFLKKSNEWLKYIMIFYFILVATLTIIGLSNGEYSNLIFSLDESMFTAISKVIEIYVLSYAIGLLIFIIGVRLGIHEWKKEKDFMMKVLVSTPLIYLVYINMKFINNAIFNITIIVIYLLIVNIIYIFTEKIEYLHGVATGKVNLVDEVETECQIIDKDVIINEVKENKKDKGEKKSARKR